MKKNLPVTNNELDIPVGANILSTTDLKGTITHINPDFVAISGFSEEECLGKNHNLVRHPDMPPEVFDDLWSTLKSGHSWMGIVKNRCKNGDFYWVKAYVTPIMKNDKVFEHQSIRSKPSADDVKRAETLYTQINENKPPRFLSKKSFRFKHKLMLTFFLIQLATLAIPLVNTAISPLMTLVSLLPGALLALAFSYREVRPLCEIFAKTNSLFDNPIACHIFTGRNDETGRIMLALKYLETESSAIIGRVDDTANDISGFSDKLTNSIGMNNLSIKNQHSETEHVANAISQISENINQVAEHAQNAAEAAHQADTETNNSKHVVQRTMDAIQELAKDVQQASEVINELHANSDRISNVVSVISGIAEQTNLLALNAAIEAARAGEQGRGFAVVADEVRTLATRTHDSTREIQEMIEGLHNNSNEAVKVMEKSQIQTDNSLERGHEAVSSLNAIGSAITTINDMTKQIAESMQQQSHAATEVSQNIINIQQASEISIFGINTSEQASNAMTDLSQNMKLLTTHFWNKRRS